MKYVYFIFFVLFIGITFGIVDIDVTLSDGSHFHSVEDMDKMTDEQLYTEILRQYKDWLNNK